MCFLAFGWCLSSSSWEVQIFLPFFKGGEIFYRLQARTEIRRTGMETIREPGEDGQG